MYIYNKGKRAIITTAGKLMPHSFIDVSEEEAGKLKEMYGKEIGEAPIDNASIKKLKEENKKLKEENEQLKGKIGQLEKENKQLKEKPKGGSRSQGGGSKSNGNKSGSESGSQG